MKRGAELVWVEDPRGHIWQGHLLGDARDRHGDGGRLRYRATVTEDLDNGHAMLVTQGAHPGSRRYRGFSNVTDAQMAGVAWARRRFYIEVET